MFGKFTTWLGTWKQAGCLCTQEGNITHIMNTYKFTTINKYDNNSVGNGAPEEHETIGSAVWSYVDYMEGEYNWVEYKKVSDEPECVELQVRAGLTLDGEEWIDEFTLFVELDA